MLRCASSFVTAAYAKYAAFLLIRTPCLQPRVPFRVFYEAVRKSPLLPFFASPSKMNGVTAGDYDKKAGQSSLNFIFIIIIYKKTCGGSVRQDLHGA